MRTPHGHRALFRTLERSERQRKAAADEYEAIQSGASRVMTREEIAAELPVVTCPECHGESALRLCGGHMIAGARPGGERCPQCWCWRCDGEGEIEA